MVTQQPSNDAPRPGLRYGIISDIHANLPALNVALEYLKNAKVDKILCLGDLVGYGNQPFDVINTLRNTPNVFCISGNHDRQAIGEIDPRMRKTAAQNLEWVAKNISVSEATYLRKLPERMTFFDEGIVMVHDSLVQQPNGYIVTPQEISKNLNYMINVLQGYRICFFGHTHIPMLIGTKAVITDLHETKSFQLDKNDVYLINPGSVGQPRDKSPLCAFGIFDAQKLTMTFVRKQYTADQQFPKPDQTFPKRW